MSYKLITKDGSAKRGEFTTPHGVIQTPVFMNVGTAAAIKGAVERAGIKPEMVEEVIMGAVLQGGLGQNVARQMTLDAGLPIEVPAMTINNLPENTFPPALLYGTFYLSSHMTQADFLCKARTLRTPDLS